MKKLSHFLKVLLLLALTLGLLSAVVFAGNTEVAEAVPVTASYTRAAAAASDFPALTLGQYTEVPIDDPAPGNDLVGICSFNPAEDGYYRIQYTSATSNATVAMVDSDDTVSNALREDYSVAEWTIYGVYKLTAGNDWLFEINAPYDSMKVLVTKEDPAWIPELPEEIPVSLYESYNLYSGFRLPSQKVTGDYYSVSVHNFPTDVAKKEINVLSGGEFIELELVEQEDSNGRVTSSYYRITGVAPGTAVLQISTTYCGQTKTSDVKINVTDLIVKAANLEGEETELWVGQTIKPKLVVYHRTGTLDSYTDIETDDVLSYTFLSEVEFLYEGQTVKALSANDEGTYTAKYPGFGIMLIEARKDGKLIAELGYNVFVTPKPDCQKDGHRYDDGKVTEDAKYLTPGKKTYTCLVCGQTHIEDIPTLTVPFTDADKDFFYYTPMLWALDNGVTNGKTNTTFEPMTKCTRGEVVTFLWRAAGSPEPKNTNNPFTDVPSNMFYYEPVLWAVENGITKGRTDTLFKPDDVCTRGEVLTFLYRAAGEPQYQTTSCPFTDVPSNWFYYEPVLWAVENVITDGRTPTLFMPGDQCTRGEVVTFLYRAANIKPASPVQ